MSIDDNIGLGTGPVFFSDDSNSSKSCKSVGKHSTATIELDVSELVRFQFCSATRKFVLEIDKIAFEKQITSQRHK
jgi:hypothetical protein